MKKNSRMWIWVFTAVSIVAATCVTFDATHAFYKLSWAGVRLYEEGAYSRALPYLVAAHHMNPDDKTMAWKLVWTYQHLGRESESNRVLEEISSRFSIDPKVSESSGDVAYATKAYALARNNYERVLAQKPSAHVRRKYIDVLLAEKKYAEAIDQIDILISSAPDDQDFRYQHAQIISAAGDHERAVRELQFLIDNGYKKKEAITMLADELRLLGRDQEAIKIYQGVVSGGGGQ